TDAISAAGWHDRRIRTPTRDHYLFAVIASRTGRRRCAATSINRPRLDGYAYIALKSRLTQPCAIQLLSSASSFITESTVNGTIRNRSLSQSSTATPAARLARTVALPHSVPDRTTCPSNAHWYRFASRINERKTIRLSPPPMPSSSSTPRHAVLNGSGLPARRSSARMPSLAEICVADRLLEICGLRRVRITWLSAVTTVRLTPKECDNPGSTCRRRSAGSSSASSRLSTCSRHALVTTENVA